ncbi:kinase-like protein [Gigaspora margarita]|uniref:Kinase-like protein n=1 Tax=Gigaspora margarita TaxID=4874 RepID=A0A8H4A5V0_GIGMA|nr:kinase-like protein [Gigaspora margarita]
MQSKGLITTPIPTKTKKRNEITNKRERAIIDALARIDRSKEVDLCYVLDCTGSMGGHLAAAKDCILQVINHIKNTNPCLKIRVGFCGYRDYNDNPNLQTFDFTSSFEKFQQNLARVIATGGGDDPEDVFGGLNAAINHLSWNDGTRVLLHIGDNPPHGRRFTRFTDLEDDYPNGDPYGFTAESVLEKMRSERILYFFGKITENTNEMIRIFRSIIGDFPVFDLVGGDPIQLINKFINATTSSIISSVSLTSTIGSRTNDVLSSRQKININPNVPKWRYISEQDGIALCYYTFNNLTELKDRRFFRKDRLYSRDYHFKIAPQPFSSGVEKCAYFAISVNNNGPSEKMVMKKYIQNASANNFERYLEAVESSTVANHLSGKFNSIAKRKNVPFVNFLCASLVRVVFNSRTHYYILEEELQNVEFKRFNTNSGIITLARPVLEAFAHFTYEHTKGYLVVCDLQGIELDDEYLLTDPAIHCIDNSRFGHTNLGRQGINKCFLANHKCNHVCKRFGLKPTNR